MFAPVHKGQTLMQLCLERNRTQAHNKTWNRTPTISRNHRCYCPFSTLKVTQPKTNPLQKKHVTRNPSEASTHSSKPMTTYAVITHVTANFLFLSLDRQKLWSNPPPGKAFSKFSESVFSDRTSNNVSLTCLISPWEKQKAGWYKGISVKLFGDTIPS